MVSGQLIKSTSHAHFVLYYILDWCYFDYKWRRLGGHLVDFRYPAGVIENTLGQGGLPRVDVG